VTYRGKVKNGVVVLEGEAKMPEGTEVRVEPINGPQPDGGSSVYDRLAQLAGKAKGLPHDLARRHDHYLHGQSAG